MWRTIKCNDGAVDMQVKGSNSNNAEDVVALIDFGNRKGDTVTLNWDRRNLPNFAMPLYLAGRTAGDSRRAFRFRIRHAAA